MYKARKQKLSNRNRILECIYRNAPISRIEIADMTEITPATITANVTALIYEGIVQETGEASAEENVPGRKKILIDIIPDYAYSIGIEFTQKGLVLCITDLKGSIIEHTLIPFTNYLASHITEKIIIHLRHMIESSRITLEKFIGIGIAVPGHMDHEQKSMANNALLWDSFQPDQIRQAFLLPVYFENNVRCMALSEYLFRPNSSPDNFAFFHVGLEMYCVNIMNGELFTGKHYVSSEIGHSIANMNGRRCECGKYGCLQTISSERWLLKIARFLYGNDQSTLLRKLVNHKEDITIDHITAAYEMGDFAITGYILDAIKTLGITASNISIIMKPEKIFLHGPLFTSDKIRNQLMDYIKRQQLFTDSNMKNSFEILPFSQLDGALGASALSVLHFLILGNPYENE